MTSANPTPDNYPMPAADPATIPPPSARSAGRRFSGELAREMGRKGAAKSIITRRAKREARLAAGLPPTPPKPKLGEIEREMSEELRLVSEQIAHTRRILNDNHSEWCEHCERGGMPAHHRAQLLRAMDGLLDRRRILRDRPLPGSKRPAPAKASRGSAMIAPLDGQME